VRGVRGLVLSENRGVGTRTQEDLVHEPETVANVEIQKILYLRPSNPRMQKTLIEALTAVESKIFYIQ
jgi:hypothetical protein